MNKDLRTYTYIHLTDQMKNLVTKYSHYYVIANLDFFFVQNFLPWKCKLGSRLQNLILVKSKICAGCKKFVLAKCV